MRTLKEAWDDFNNSVIPKEAGDNQRLDMRAAFYGGARVAFNLVVTIPDNEDAAFAQLNAIESEFQAFRKELESLHSKNKTA